MMGELYGVILVGHIVSVISWMAGLLYLPRLFVYHCQVDPGSETASLFKVMERKLLHAITIPAAIAAWFFGGLLVVEIGLAGQGWLHVKLSLVVVLSAYTAIAEKWRRDFTGDHYPHSERFFRIANEIPAVLMIAIVPLVVLKPF